MGSFTRSFYTDKNRSSAIDTLRRDRIFIEKLTKDIMSGYVFPALRENWIDFYHGGGVLFRFEGKKFKRNPAYNHKIGKEMEEERKKDKSKKSPGAVPEDKYRLCYDKYVGHKYNRTFFDDYGVFKDENVDHFIKSKDNSITVNTPKERQYLTNLYKAFSPFVTGSENDGMILLDIEAGFPADPPYGKCQIDAVFLDKKDTPHTLYFVEVKGADDDRLAVQTKEDETPEYIYRQLEEKKGSKEYIGYQIKKYKANLDKRTDEIESAYTAYIEIMREIFENHLPKESPVSLKIYPKPKLIIYGEAATGNYKRCLKAVDKKLGNELIKLDNGECLSDYKLVTKELRKGS